MIKWYDDIEKQIKEIQEEVDGIEAGEVDAKNLSEVLDKDAPVTITTDLQNNKVKVGLVIDDDTLEVDNGKLKVKQASGGKKYLHHIELYNNDVTYAVMFDIITEDKNAYTTVNAVMTALDALPTHKFNIRGTLLNGIVPCTSTYKYSTSGLSRAFYIHKVDTFFYACETYASLTNGTITGVDQWIGNRIDTLPFVNDGVTEL